MRFSLSVCLPETRGWRWEWRRRRRFLELGFFRRNEEAGVPFAPAKVELGVEGKSDDMFRRESLFGKSRVRRKMVLDETR
jgi:hypothetical protein